jgi:hypothetical protein
MSPPRSPLDYDVSVSADKSRRTRRRGMSGSFGAAHRTCDHPQCQEKAEYRAPKTWNFFADYTEEELEAQRRADTVWDRPTWSFRNGTKKLSGDHIRAEGRAWNRFGFDDPFTVLGENATINPGDRRVETRRRMLPKNEVRALEVLCVEDSLSRTEIRAAFKSLVKDLHPDMNGGTRADEDRLREVLWAWEQIRHSKSFRE